MWNKNFILLLLFSVFVTSSLCDSEDKYVSKANKRSLVIIFDGTGSMYDDLDQLRAGSKILINGFDAMANNPIGNYILVVYRDDDRDIITPTVETTNKNVLFNYLDEIKLIPNLDCPESAYTAILRGLKNANDGSYVFVFTDASTKKTELRDDILKVVQKKNAKIYFFVTYWCSDPNHTEYKQLASNTNGLVFEVDRTKINQAFPKFLEIISDHSSDGPGFNGTAGNTTTQIHIDSTIDKFVVIITANKPVITIFDPDKNEIKSCPILTDEPKVKIIQCLHPIPGTWTVNVDSKTSYSGQLSITSNLGFKYGFSHAEPKSITQTYYYPIPGQNNMIIVTASNDSLVGNLSKVVLATKTNRYDYKLNKKTVGGEILYMTDLISLPKEPFKIYLFGRDNLSYNLIRLLSTAISAHDPDAPDSASTYSLINVLEGQPIKLGCQANSPIALTIQWKKEGGDVLKEMKAEQSELLIHTIEYAELTDAGSYICSAENRIGRTEAKTIVDVRNVALNVNTPLKARNELEGTKEVVLKCVVSPRWKINISWQYNGSSILPPDSKLDSPNLILTTVKRSHSGTYTCIGKKASEEQQDSIILNVFYPPTITNIIQLNKDLTSTILDPKTSIQITDMKTVSFLCESDGSPTPKTHWFYGSGDKINNEIIEINGNNPSASGSYVCVAENDHGKVQKTINVVIQIPPKLIEDYKSNFDLLLHDTFSLECPIQKLNNNGETVEWFKVSGYNLEWFKNDIKIDEIHVNSGKLNFKIVEMGMNGSFSCKASNLAGKVEAKFNMKILFPLQIINLYKSDDYATDSALTYSLINVLEGQPIKLSCQANSPIALTIQWKKDGGDVLKEIKSEQSELLTHTIEYAELTDAGSYICSAENRIGRTEAKTIVDVRNVALTMNTPIKTRNELEGTKQVVLECVVIPRGKTDISWQYNESSILPPDSKLDLPNLMLTTVKRSHSGTYTCIGKKASEEQQDYIVLNVFYPPTITNIIQLNKDLTSTILDPKKSIQITDMKTVSFLCESDGSPTPKTHWFYGSGDKINNEIIEINGNNPSASGSYVCVAENDHGKVQKTINVVIQIPPKLIEDYKSNFDLLVHDRFSLECPIQKLNNNGETVEWFKVSGYNLEWFKNDIKIDGIHVNSGKLNFKIVEMGMNGSFICKASNLAGKVEAKFNMKILFPPQIINLYKSDDYSTTLINNKDLIPIINLTKFSVLCESIGNPKPTTTWIFQNGKKASENNILNIDASNPSGSGIYTCQVQNNHGENQISIRLKILVKPRLILNYKKYHELILNEEFQLECPIEKILNNEEIIEWFYNGKKLGSLYTKNGLLTLKKVPKDITGQFSCKASNAAGFVEATFDFNILFPPKIIKFLKSDEYTTSTMVDIKNPVNIINLLKTEIVCVSEGNPKPQINWMYDNSVIVSNNEKLEIDTNNPSASGIYSCKIENNQGTDVKDLNIKVLIPPKLQEEYDTQHYLILNEPFSLDCPYIHVDNNDEVTEWYHNGVIVDSFYTSDSEIYFQKVKMAMNGRFTCRVTNAAGNVEAHFLFDVHFPPKILNLVTIDNDGNENVIPTSLTNIDVYNTNSFEIVCKADGNPPPTVLWKRNKVDISSDNSLTIYLGSGMASGDYSCHIESYIGYDVRNIIIKEILPPKLIKNYNKLITATENSSLIIRCPVEDGEYDTTWNSNYDFSMYKKEDGSIEIPVLHYDMKTRLHCTASNKANTVSAFLELDVLSAPYDIVITTKQIKNRLVKINSTHTRIAAIHLEPFDIKCSAKANPPPEIMWVTGNRLYSKTDSIYIKSVKYEDNQVFRCIAKNDLKENSHFVQLIVFTFVERNLIKGTNKMKYQKKMVTVIDGKNVSPDYFIADFEKEIILDTDTKKKSYVMNCAATGNPNPNITWYKNGNTISHNKSILELNSITSKDGGIYKCVCNNKYGSISQIFYIHVEVPYSLASISSTKYDYTENDEIRLRCITKGNFLPTITWRFANSRLVTNKRILKYSDQKLKYRLLNNEAIYIKDRHETHKSNIANLDNYGILSYKYKNGEYLGKLVYVIKSASIAHSGNYTCDIDSNRRYNNKKLGVIKNSISIKVNAWSDWSTCSVTCGNGFKTRKRICLHAGLCSAESETKECFLVHCPIDGGWSKWSEYGACSKSCVYANSVDVSVKKRYRVCDFPEPKFNGRHCRGKDEQPKKCDVPICCPSEFTYDDNLKKCLENDQCKRKGSTRLCDDKSQDCFKVKERFKCVCKKGYTTPKNHVLALDLLNKDRKCEDINECKKKTDKCDKNQQCFNTNGGYRCAYTQKNVTF